MNPALRWIKSNAAIVALTAGIIVILPAGWVGSSMWNSSIRKQVHSRANKDLSQLRASDVNYRVEPIVPDAPAIEFSGKPNQRITDFFAQTKEKMASDAKAIVELAERINRSDHEPLMARLLPEPTGTPMEVKNRSIDVARLIVPSGDPESPTAYERMLEEVGAGGPPDQGAVAQVVADLVEGERMRVQAERGTTTLTADEQKQLTTKLVARRIGEYQRRAQEISLYADIGIFPAKRKPGMTSIPTRAPDKPQDSQTIYEWHADYWAFREVLRAVASANAAPDGPIEGRAAVPEATVKRVISIDLSRLPITAEDNLRARAGEDLTPYGVSEIIPANYSASFTGRSSSAKNQIYDVRNARVVLVAASDRLGALIDAIGASNFMTVIDMDIEAVDPWKDLAEGYAYGSEHVVRVSLTIETVWLRSWTRAYMPGIIRFALGIPEDEATTDDGNG